MSESVLTLANVCVEVGPPTRRVLAMRDVSFTLEPGMRLGIVGESGSGKSTTALAILGILAPGAVIRHGSIRYGVRELVGLRDADYARLRGKEIAIVFQSASAALNPLIRVGDQIADVVRRHEGVSKSVAHRRAVEMLAALGLADPERNARAYPHQYSGGMAQRALIAMALACRPLVLIADEPTTGLDPIVQAQVLDQIVEQVTAQGASLILISHDLAVIARACTHIAVMYAGEVVEDGPAETLLTAPAHPYTRALMAAVAPPSGDRFSFIPGRVPTLDADFAGCSFRDRCPLAAELGHPPECRDVAPTPRFVAPGHLAACHFVKST